MPGLIPKSLLWRIGLAIMLMQVAVGILLGAYGYFRARGFYFEQTLQELRTVSPLLVERYREALAAGDATALQPMVREDSDATGMRITVIDPTGLVLAESHSDPATMANHRYRPEIDAAFERGDGSERRYSETVDQHMLYYARAVAGSERDGDGRAAVGVVRNAIAITELNDAFTGVARVIGIAGLATVLLTGVIVYLISRHLSRQVIGMAEGARRFADGELSHRIHQPPSSELASLAESLNEMARQMARRIEHTESQERETRAILQSMSNGVIALDAEQRVLNVNRAARAMFDLDDVNVEGKLLQEVIREPDVHRFVARALEASDMTATEFERFGDHRTRIQIAGEILRAREGGARGLLLILQDVTRLRRLESMRSDFAANVSHELRTPITNIKGYVETLLDIGVDDAERTTRFLSVIRQNSDRLAAIVEDVLALTRLEEEAVGDTLDKEPTRLLPIVKSVIAQFSERAADKEIRVEMDVAPELAARVHAPLIEQAIGNLLSNAINYSPPRTTVRVVGFGGDDGSAAVLEVRDQGPGIAKKHLARLFERFYRVDKGRSRELGGTGLGLAIVKHIMNVHDGRVEVESEVGKGSTFRLVMP